MNRAVNTFERERHRYRLARMDVYHALGRQYRADETERMLNAVERSLVEDPEVADDYLLHWSIGREYGADTNWVSQRLLKLTKQLVESENADEELPYLRGLAEKSTPGLMEGRIDQQGFRDWERGQPQLGVHPLAKPEKTRGGGFRDSAKLEDAFHAYLLDVGGAAIRPGVEVPREVVSDFIDKVHAHRDYLEPLGHGLDFDYMTQAYIYITTYPEVLRIKATGDTTSKLLQSKYKNGRRRSFDPKFTQYCRYCGLPFLRFTNMGNPTTKFKYCGDDCKRAQANRVRRKGD